MKVANPNAAIRGHTAIRLYAFSNLAVRYMPVIAAVFMLIHITLLLEGTMLYFSEIAFGSSVMTCVFMMAASYAFGYCSLHRSFILYNFAVSCCIHYHRIVGFGSFLAASRWIMFSLGIFLFIRLIIHRGFSCSFQPPS